MELLVKGVVQAVRQAKSLSPVVKPAGSSQPSPSPAKPVTSNSSATKDAAVCKKFLRGKCNRKGKCRYSHVLPQGDPSVLIKAILEANKALPVNKQVANPQQALKGFKQSVQNHKKKSNKSSQTCKHAMAGNHCSFYPNCKFIHPNFGSQPEGSNNASGVPPVPPPAQAPGIIPTPPHASTAAAHTCCAVNQVNHHNLNHTQPVAPKVGQGPQGAPVFQGAPQLQQQANYSQPQPQLLVSYAQSQPQPQVSYSQPPLTQAQLPQPAYYPGGLVPRLPVINPSSVWTGPGAWAKPLYL